MSTNDTTHETVHESLREAGDLAEKAGDLVHDEELDITGREMFAELCWKVASSLRQMALLAEAVEVDHDDAD